MVKCPELLDLISKDKEWDMTKNGTESCVPEYKKLELRLGLPGEGRNLNVNYGSGEFFLSSAKFLPYYKSGAKRVLYEKAEGIAGDDFQPHKLIFSEKTAEKVSPISSCPRAVSLSSLAFQKSSFLQQLLMPQKLDMVSEESANQCSNSVSVPADSSVPKSSYERPSVAPAVGWPPIRSSRKNFAARHSSKAGPLDSSNETLKKENGSKSVCCKGQMFVKVCMDGVPIGRKLNLQAFDSYEKLSAGIDELFHCLLAAQRDYLVAEDERKTEEAKTLSDFKHENGPYTLVYYDNEGDRMLVGDVPWNMFVSTVKRLHVLKSSAMVATEMK